MRDADLTTLSVPSAALRLIRRAADAQRTGATGVVVIRLTEEDRLARTSALLRFAHALGLRTILEAEGAAIEHLVARRPELVSATIRATDAVVVASSRSAALVRDLSGGRLRVEIAAPSAPTAVRRLQRTLAAA